MYKSFLSYSLWTLFILIVMSSCEKAKEANVEVNVSNQWSIDQFGVVISAPNDEQWAKKAFTASELDLFADMDTTKLAGTTMPITIRMTSNYSFPNPFVNHHSFGFRFDDNFSGEVVLKYVVVDNKLNVIDRKVARLTANSGYAAVVIAPNLPTGQYRLYYTLSSQGNAHFYQCWGNVQKIS